MEDEQRRHKRRGLRVDFHGQDAEGAGELLLQGEDLSQGGAFLRSDVLLETGETLGLTFHIPGAPQPVNVQSRVAWVRRFPTPEQPAGMGVEFLSMAAEDFALLERWFKDEA